MHRPLIVGIGGTTRQGSTSERALAHALAAVDAAGGDTLLIPGTSLPLEPFDPASPRRSAEALHLVESLRRADGVIVSTPSYHGSISGLVKNALDFTEDLREDDRPYLHGRAVGCVICAEGAQAMGLTLVALRSVVHSLRGWPTPYAATVDSATRPFAAGDPAPEVIAGLRLVASQVLESAQMRRLAEERRAQTVQG